MGLIKTQNVLVGVSNKYIKNSANYSGTTGATTDRMSLILTPTTDASNLNVGDILTIGSHTETPAILSIDSATGTVFFGTIAATVTNGEVVTQIWRNLGASDGGVDLTGQITKTPQYVDDTIWAVQYVLTKGEAGLVIPLAEILMKNLALAFGDEVASVTVSAGQTTYKVNPTTVREDQYLITGNGPDGSKRTIFAPRGINQGSVSLKMDKVNKQILALRIDCAFDSTPTRNYPVKFIDYTSFVYTGH